MTGEAPVRPDPLPQDQRPDLLAVVVPVFNEPAVSRTLDALRRQRDSRFHVFVVDNGSTDDTAERLRRYAEAYPELLLTIVTERQKGTGAACDTGFRRAIAEGLGIVARTDGDSEPASDWTERIREAFDRNAGTQLVGGTSTPLRDHHYRWGDDLLVPGALRLLRPMMAAYRLDPAYLRFVAGHNMAVRSSAYLSTGGFERTAIDRKDEDIDFSVRIARSLGRQAVCIDPGLRVATSMRRVRRYGIVLMGVHHLVPALRGRLIRAIDVR
jgi:glycosyltransferase involved in cell wall biosynthesis